jgi:hypothetical protein
MGLRFRKSIKIAPGVKVNLNKKSVGVTIGGKGMHYTVNSKGRRTTTVGLPGTGLSYQHVGQTKKASKARARRVKTVKVQIQRTGPQPRAPSRVRRAHKRHWWLLWLA